ncbi:proton-conducting transporter membrane subunit [Pseudomonadota bacterium]
MPVTLGNIAAYGLVVHDGTSSSRRAGRIYLIMTLVAEFALLFAFIMIYWRTGTLTPSPAQLIGAGTAEIALLMLAFGIKAGLIGLHVWLPLAHPAAPVPASAVLSGAMIKTALIGWMRFLPFGHESLPEWGLLLLAAGAAGALIAVPLGLPQQNPKVVLAYSSIGKMGTLVSALGLALIEPQAAAGIIAAVTLFAAHHGLAKGALFLGVGVVKSSHSHWMFLLLLIPALALAGLPFTSGASAKALLSLSALEAAGKWSWIFFWMLPIAAVGTALLMARFLYLMHQLTEKQHAFSLLPALPWLALLSLILLLPLTFGNVPALIESGWPIAVASTIAILILRARPAWLLSLVGRVPPGDLIGLLSAVRARCGSLTETWLSRVGGNL